MCAYEQKWNKSLREDWSRKSLNKADSSSLHAYTFLGQDPELQAAPIHPLDWVCAQMFKSA